MVVTSDGMIELDLRKSQMCLRYLVSTQVVYNSMP
jgi:hypothetical protein